MILWAQSCPASREYRAFLAVENYVAQIGNIPRGGEHMPFWSIFRNPVDTENATTTENIGKKDFVHNPLYLANGDGRGGALIVKKSWKEKLRENQFLKPRMENTIEPSQSGLVAGHARTNDAHASAMSSIKKLWWVNLREMTDLGNEQALENDDCSESQLEFEKLQTESPEEEPEDGLTLKLVAKESKDIPAIVEVHEDKRNDDIGEQRGHDRDDRGVMPAVAVAVGEQELSTARKLDDNDVDIESAAVVRGREEKVLNTDEEMDFVASEGQILTINNNVEATAKPSDDSAVGQADVIELISETPSTSIEALEPLPGSTPDNQFGSESPFISSGYWETIDKILTLGLAANKKNLRMSRQLRPIRKVAAKMTGMHGALSKKPYARIKSQEVEEAEPLDSEDLEVIRRRIAAIDRARAGVERMAAKEDAEFEGRRRGPFQRFRRRERESELYLREEIETQKSIKEIEAAQLRFHEDERKEQMRKDRVLEIDRAITEGQRKLLELQCEKDAIQRRPNPLYNYSTVEEEKGGVIETHYTRTFSFPTDELVDEYLNELFDHGRLLRMNHTYIWKSGAGDEDDEDESIGDDLFTPSAGARKLYRELEEDYELPRRRKSSASELRRGNGGGGSWLLRQTLGQGSSLGEKIGEAVETAAYKSICAALMASLARTISAIHGVNILAHSDIRVFIENSPDLPPLTRDVIMDKDYAHKAIVGAMREGSQKRKKKAYKGSKSNLSDEAFIQRGAIVETLMSHCQISAPLLKLFPLAWQRALLGNVITLIAAVVSDFCDGIQLQILGHQLSFNFKPITESDMIRHIGMAGNGFNHRRARPEEFEAAVRATAEDISAGLSFLDKWHERALGSGMLRAQVANLIARIVLTLADEVLSGARMDLWSAQAGGPRLVAGLEYRTSPEPL